MVSWLVNKEQTPPVGGNPSTVFRTKEIAFLLNVAKWHKGQIIVAKITPFFYLCKMRKFCVTPAQIAFFLFLAIFSPVFAHLPPGFAQYEIASGLNPTDMAIAPDGRIFITEKNGLVRLVVNEELLPDPFAVLLVNDFNERGLGHIGLDPDFANNGFVYVYYTVVEGSHNRLSRLTAQGNLMLPGSEVVLYECDSKYGSVHNGGDFEFGKDGKIYLATGENASGVTGPQSLTSDLGKVLRLNPDGTIPTDNPFYTTAAGKYRSIYALGFRNPFSLTIDPESGNIYVGDVGGTTWEEINEVKAGRNYGFPLLEGKANGQPTPADYEDPIYTYDHNTGCAVTGICYYNPTSTNFPSSCKKKLFFADYCKGYIGQYNPATGIWERNFADQIARPICLQSTPTGSFYYLARAGIGGGSEEDNTASDNGSLWRIIYTGSNAPFIYLHPKSNLYSVGDPLRLEALAVGEKPMGVFWQKNGVTILGADSTVLEAGLLSLADSGAVFRCIIMNEYGADTSKPALIRVTSNKRPQITIMDPSTDYLYRAGDTLFFAGQAVDPETGLLDSTALSWKIYFYHDTHYHPAMSPTKHLYAGNYAISTIGEPSDNVWYRIFLTATDTIGLSTTAYRDVYPEKAPILVTTDPSNLPVDIDGIKGPAPFLSQGVVGMQRAAVVPDIVLQPDSVLLFHHWNDGHAIPEYDFVVPADTGIVLQAHYERFPVGKGFGLLGTYLQPDLQEPSYLVRIDSFIDFKWGEGAPSLGMPVDGFTVRWTGTVEPYFSDTLTFYTYSDDGARLWVNDQLLIDHWTNQPATEHSGSIYLEGGTRYSIRVEFLEAGGAATMQLWWSSTRVPKAIVPSTQLYPPASYLPNSLSGSVWLDQNGNGGWDPSEPPLPQAVVVLTDLSNPLTSIAALTDTEGNYSLQQITSSKYQLYVAAPTGYGSLVPGIGLGPGGFSNPIQFNGEEDRQFFCAFIPDGSPALQSDLPSWQLLPNPATDQVTLRKNHRAFLRSLPIQVLDLQGKLVVATTSPAGTRDTVLDISRLATGIYIVVADGQAVQLFKQ